MIDQPDSIQLGIFLEALHHYLIKHKTRYSGNYHHLFMREVPPGFFGHPTKITFEQRDFFSLCQIAGKKCGLISPSNETLPVLLDGIQYAWNQAPENEKKIISEIFAKKTPVDINEDDLLEVGLYGKINAEPRSPGQRILRHQNLQVIYGQKNQDSWKGRPQYSLPEHIHVFTTTDCPSDTHLINSAKETLQTQDKKIPETETLDFAKHQRQELFSSELCKVQYHVESKYGSRYWKIKQATKNPVIDHNQYFLSSLEDTLRKYFNGFKHSQNFFGRSLKWQSTLSKKLYNDLYNKILCEEKTNEEKVSDIISRLEEESTQKSSRRLINTLRDAGFMNPDLWRKTPDIAICQHAVVAAESTPDKISDAHQGLH